MIDSLQSPFRGPPGPLFYGALKALVVLVAVLGFVVLTDGCAPPSTAAPTAYGAELEVCRRSASTCEGYLACRHRIQDKYGRPRSGWCQ